ncbi:uncharacterized protein LOC128254933 [Drosophila gunungcola]|uniref:uncharacterized protein LOC128254933 n=1 Tax=Drosophila gunungcola TaxID=103775 RepID=UPI0022E7ADCF|nr:uncharacterized protein LOC128254933 [Drosophila gunungcola]
MGCGTKLPLRLRLSWVSMAWIWVWFGIWMITGPASGEVLRCYVCNDTDTSCGSSWNSIGHVEECPNSTVCSMTAMFHMVNGKPWKTTLRGCGEQLEKKQKYVDKVWVDHYVLVDLPEGCFSKYRAEQCYCRGSLCNSAGFPSSDFRLPMLLLFLALACGKILLPV